MNECSRASQCRKQAPCWVLTVRHGEPHTALSTVVKPKLSVAKQRFHINDTDETQEMGIIPLHVLAVTFHGDRWYADLFVLIIIRSPMDMFGTFWGHSELFVILKSRPYKTNSGQIYVVPP